jgi:hypothetical protein
MRTFHLLLLAAIVPLLGLGVSSPASAQCASTIDEHGHGISEWLTVDDCLAQCASPIDEYGYVPRSAFYFSLGGSYNSVDFGDQDIIAIGTSDIFDASGPLIATGIARGPDDATGGTPISMDLQVSFTPSIEVGYFQHFAGSNCCLWGAKFTNDYFGVTSDVRLPRLPQVGAFTFTPEFAPDPDNNTVPFTGNAVALSAQTEIVDQMALRPFIGHSFKKGFVYFGGGPTLSLLRTEVRDLVGFADIEGARGDISGAPQDFSVSDWVWGGSAQVGVTYFLDRRWFLDCSYTFAISSKHTFNFSSSFSNTGSFGDFDDVILDGGLDGSSTWQAITQAISFKIGRTL